jgi:hypothetical protein
VVVCRPKDRPDWNGKIVSITGYDENTHRYSVVFLSKDTNNTAIGPDNLQLPNGTEVVLTKLTKKPEMNGRVGTIFGFVEETSRYKVQLQGGAPGSTSCILLKMETVVFNAAAATYQDSDDDDNDNAW